MTDAPGGAARTQSAARRRTSRLATVALEDLAVRTRRERRCHPRGRRSDRREQEWLQDYFLLHVSPDSDPLAVDPAHPFPLHSQYQITLALELNPREGKTMSALVPRIPGSVERCIPQLPMAPSKAAARFAMLDQLIVTLSVVVSTATTCWARGRSRHSRQHS